MEIVNIYITKKPATDRIENPHQSTYCPQNIVDQFYLRHSQKSSFLMPSDVPNTNCLHFI